MRGPPRGLSAEEAALWARVAATVKPLHGHAPRKVAVAPVAKAADAAPPVPVRKVKGRIPPPPPPPAPPPSGSQAHQGLDSHWERRLARSSIISSVFTLSFLGR